MKQKIYLANYLARVLTQLNQIPDSSSNVHEDIILTRAIELIWINVPTSYIPSFLSLLPIPPIFLFSFSYPILPLVPSISSYPSFLSYPVLPYSSLPSYFLFYPILPTYPPYHSSPFFLSYPNPSSPFFLS
jgi:hypothetical protein